MTTVRIPLVGSYNQRNIAGNASLVAEQDQRFKNCVFNAVKNPVTGKVTIYVEKRPGWGRNLIVAAGSASTGLIKPQSFNAPITAFGETNSVIYWNDTSVGTITGRALHFKETLISNVGYIMIKSSDGTGWYYVDGAKTTLTYTGDTHTNTTLDNLGSTAGMYSGQKVSGTNIVAGTRISSVNSGTAVTLDTATTGTTAGVTVTKEPIAKILSANFVTTGTQQSAFAELDGYLFYVVDTTGNLYSSNLNTVQLYTAADFIGVNMSPDPPVAITRQKNAIIVLGSASKEVFQDVGNATGSPLQRVPQFYEQIGTLDQRSVTSLENDIYFVSSPKYGDLGVYRIRDFKTEKVSTPALDRIIGTYASSGTIYVSSFKLGGYQYVQLFLSTAIDGPASNVLLESGDKLLLETTPGGNLLLEDTAGQTSSFNRTLLYNPELELWLEWDASVATFIDGGSIGSANTLFATSRTNTSGYIYTINPTADGQLYQDDGSAYTMEIRTSKMDFGTSKRKRIKSIRLICDSDSTGSATLEWSDDDYATWSTPRTFDLTSKEPKLPACGSHKGYRAYRLKHASNSNFRAEALEIEYESEADKIQPKTAG